MTCVAIKKDKSICGLGAKYTHPSDGSLRCGTHMRDVSNKDDYLISGSKSSKAKSTTTKSKASTPTMTNDEILNAMIDRIAQPEICTIAITKSDSSIIMSILEFEDSKRDMFMKGLIKSCPPGKDGLDFDNMILTMREKYASFNKALTEKFTTDAKKLYPHWLDKNVLVMEAIPVIADHEGFTDYIENGWMIHHSDVKITVVNCKTVGVMFMDEWLKNPNNIYIGPSFVFPHLIEKDSEYFIPNNSKYPSRVLQNKEDIKRIIKNIEDGVENPEKYLSLQGKTLGSVCIPYPCHSEVLVEVVRWLKSK